MAVRFRAATEHARRMSHTTDAFLERGHRKSWGARDIQMISGDVRRGLLDEGQLRNAEDRARLAVGGITGDLALARTEAPRLRALLARYAQLLVVLKRHASPTAALDSERVIAFYGGKNDLTEAGLEEMIREVESGKGGANDGMFLYKWVERETREAIDKATYRADGHERHMRTAPKTLEAYGKLRAAIARQLPREAVAA